MNYKIFFLLAIVFWNGSCIDITVSPCIPYMDVYYIKPFANYEVKLECDNLVTLEVYDFLVSSSPIVRNESVTSIFITQRKNTLWMDNPIQIHVINNQSIEEVKCNIVVTQNNTKFITVLILIITAPIILCCILFSVITLTCVLSYCNCIRRKKTVKTEDVISSPVPIENTDPSYALMT